MKELPVILRDLTGVAGATLIAYGSYRIYAPAGFIMAGMMLLAASILLARGGQD